MSYFLISCLSAVLVGQAPVGEVSQSRQGSEIVGEHVRPAEPHAPFQMHDILRSDQTGAIAAILEDDTTLSVGPNAELKVDEFVYDPNRSVGELTISLGKGALRMVSGRINKQADHQTRIDTPVASMGIRGTDVWIGEVDGEFGVLLLRGLVEVSTDAGTTVLDEPGEGLTVTSRSEPPSEPVRWDAAKRARALSQTTF